MARQVEGAPASLNVNFDICMASAMCKSTTMPPAINWSQELADLRQEMADPLVPLPRFAGTSTCHTPPDDQRRPAPHHALLALQTLPVRAKIEGQLARKTLLQWVLRYAVMSFHCSPCRSLQAGEICLTQGNFGNQIVDFADRAMRLRCCNQHEAWHMLTMPAVAMERRPVPAF